MANAYWDRRPDEPHDSEQIERAMRSAFDSCQRPTWNRIDLSHQVNMAKQQNWTEQDEQEYARWAASRPYAPPPDIEPGVPPLWQDALIIIGLLAFCGMFWVWLVWMLFF